MRTAAHMVRTVPGVSTLCKDELPAGLVVRGHGPPGGSRPASRSVTQTDRLSNAAIAVCARLRPRIGRFETNEGHLRRRSASSSHPRGPPKSLCGPPTKRPNAPMFLGLHLAGDRGTLTTSRQRDSSAQTVARSRFGGIPGTRRHASVRVPADSSQLALRPPRVFTGFDGQRRWHERARVAVECRC